MLNKKITIGCEEWLALPEIGMPAVKARVDSGAKTSSLHAFNIKEFKRGDEAWVSFELHPLQKNKKISVFCEKPICDKRLIKSSMGGVQARYVIKTPLKISDQIFEVELTLANRDSMGFRMLLGREAMSGRVVIDPELRFCLGKKSKKEIKQFYC